MTPRTRHRPLTSDGWTEQRVRESGERTVDGYRKDGSYAEVASYATVPDKAELIEATIESALTVRGGR